MKTFDEIIPAISEALAGQENNLEKIGCLVVNRDLNGLIRLVVKDSVKKNETAARALNLIVELFSRKLEGRFPDKTNVLYEPDPLNVLENTAHFLLPGFTDVIIADRLINSSDWLSIEPIKGNHHRIIFYSVKGGVGRSTALAASAWALAEEGRKVMVIDLDLESPGLSSSLLPEDKCPMYGVIDWLVEDLADNEQIVFDDMVSVSDLSRNGEIFVVPAHGKDPGEYIAKLGRAWVSKLIGNRVETWQKRLSRLIDDLEKKWKPDIVLIDSRAGIDEISAACISSLGAELILLFAVDSNQHWTGYDILFKRWGYNEAFRQVRDRLQIVGAMIPEKDDDKYKELLCEHAWNLFTAGLYETVNPENSYLEPINYDKNDREAPHYPWPILWNTGFSVLSNLYEPLAEPTKKPLIMAVFGPLIENLKMVF